MNNSENHEKPTFISLENNDTKVDNLPNNIDNNLNTNINTANIVDNNLNTNIVENNQVENNNLDTNTVENNQVENNNVINEIPIISPLSSNNAGTVNTQQVNQPINNTDINTQPINNNMVPNNNISPSNSQNNTQQDDGIVTENLKKVEINYKPPSKFQTTVLVLFFIGLIAFVIFLPEVTKFIENIKHKEVTEEKIVNGKLICNLNTSTANLTYEYSTLFSFKENKLQTMRIESSTKGDVNLDEETLNNLNLACIDTEKESKKIDGLTITCEYSEGLLKEIQSYELKDLNEEDLKAAFIESGGTNPEYQYDDDMDQVEKEMKRAGYTCRREKDS